MLDIHLVAIHELASEITVYLVEVETVASCDQVLGELDVIAYLTDVASASRIVAGRLDSSRQTCIAFKTDNVVGLPAMEGNLGLPEDLDSLVGIHTYGCIAFFGHLIGLDNLFLVHILLIIDYLANM